MRLHLENISYLSEQIVQFMEELSQNEKVKRLIVFGSRACGDFEKFSDLDLAVDAPELTKKEWLFLKEQAYYYVRTVLQISLVHFAHNPMRLQERIIKDGVIIYGKK